MKIRRGRNQRAKLGRLGENIAAELLTSLGMNILARNWRCRVGELDVVALDDNEIVFAEVKTLRQKNGFSPASNLSFRQRKRNYHAALVYLKALDITGIPGRFELIEITFKGRFLHKVIRHADYLPPLPPGATS